MGETSRRFNFDDFDAQIAEALAETTRRETDAQMASEGRELDERKRYPGEIGGVAIQLSFDYEDPLILGDYPPLLPGDMT